MWITSSYKKDLNILLLPTLMILPLTYLINYNSSYFFLLIIFGIGFCDTGHVFTTIFRILGDDWRFKSQKFLMIIAPIFIFVTLFYWFQKKAIYFGFFLLSITIFHNYRQFYGFLSWYMRRNNRSCRLSVLFFNILTLMPVLILPFRSINYQVTLDIHNFFGFKLPPLDIFYFNIFIGIYLLFLFLWLIHELYLIIKKTKEPSRFLAMIIPIILYGHGLFFAENLFQIVLPLASVHGLSYMFAVILSLKRIDNRPKIVKNNAVIFVLSTSLIIAFFYTLFKHPLFIFYTNFNNWNILLQSLVKSLFSSITLTHYLWDMFLWNSKDPDFRTIVAKID